MDDKQVGTLPRQYDQRWCAFIAQSSRFAFGMAARADGDQYVGAE